MEVESARVDVMGGFRLAGVLWIVGGLSSASLVVFVLGDPVLVTLLAGGGIVGVLIGGLLIARPGPGVVRWSHVAGVAWLIAFGALSLTQLDEPIGERLSVIWVIGFGVAGALVAYRRRAAAAVA